MTIKTPGPGQSFDRVLGFISAVPLALIVALTFIDVFARYFFAHPVPGAAEIIQFAMAMAIFTALPVVTRAGGHITVDLFSHALSPRIRAYLQLPCELLSAVALALITWRLWTQATEYGQNDTMTLVLRLPMAPLAYAMAVFAALAVAAVGLRFAATMKHVLALPETNQ